MQTFLPNKSAILSAKILDPKRLGKQRVEAFQILNILHNNKKAAWSHHPAVLQWMGHENALAYYMNCMIKEWIRRGYNNTMRLEKVNYPIKKPAWICETLVRSHQSMLYQKDPVYYKCFKNVEKVGYFWPYRWVNGKITKTLTIVK